MTMTSWPMVVSLGVTILGFGTAWALRGTPAAFVLNHVGALGALGLLAGGSGLIAARKSFGFWRVWSLGLASSVASGLAFAFAGARVSNGATPPLCGGSVSLGVALAVLAVCAVVRPRLAAPKETTCSTAWK